MTIELPAVQASQAIASPSPGRLRGWARPLAGLLLPVGIALGWEVVVWLGLSNGRLVPPPTRIFTAIAELARSGELARHVTATLSRVIAGFGLGVIAGTVLGAISGYWDLARRLVDPTVQALRAIPSLAWVPLFILWLGIFETSKVALIAVGVFFPVYLGVMGAILSSIARSSRSDASSASPGRRWCGASCCPPCCRHTWCRCVPGLALGGCSSSRPSSWAPPKGSVTC